jgi:hypothetical protein
LEVGTGTSQLWDRPAHDYTTLKMRRLQAGSIDTHTIDIHIKKCSPGAIGQMHSVSKSF